MAENSWILGWTTCSRYKRMYRKVNKLVCTMNYEICGIWLFEKKIGRLVLLFSELRIKQAFNVQGDQKVKQTRRRWEELRKQTLASKFKFIYVLDLFAIKIFYMPKSPLMTSHMQGCLKSTKFFYIKIHVSPRNAFKPSRRLLFKPALYLLLVRLS